MTTDLQACHTRRGHAEHRSEDGSLTVLSPSGVVAVLNPTAAALWELCDSKTSAAEVVTAATSLFAGPPEDIQRDILLALEKLQREGLLD